MMPPVEATTASGYDLSFGTNVLGKSLLSYLLIRIHTYRGPGHFYFTKLLLPILIQTSGTFGAPTRIVNTSSSAHYLSMHDFNTFKDGPTRRKLTIMQLYGQSKWVS
jgi:NAD(P)-dependent dehydrogenase (short-subunit alcohol dehydrogenase family)